METTNQVKVPSQLADWPCIILKKGSKEPIGEMKNWAKDVEHRTYKVGSAAVKHYLEMGYNYGVVALGNVIVAPDTDEAERLCEGLPKTLTDRSPRHKKKHFVYYVDDGPITKVIHCKEEPDPITGKDSPVCDIRTGHYYAVGPGSYLEGFGRYEVVDDLPIAHITQAQLIEALKGIIVEEREIPKYVETGDHSGKFKFDITKLLERDKYQRSGSELVGPHPIHGSTTGSNFHVNPEKGCWYCFRAGHESGGGSLELLAVIMGVLKCEECHKGALTGEKFWAVVKEAVSQGYLSNDALTERAPADGKNYTVTVDGRTFILAHEEKNGTPDNPHIKVILHADQIIDYLMTKYTFKTPTDMDQAHVFQDGVYIKAEHIVYADLEDKLGVNISREFLNEVMGHIERKTYVDRSLFNCRKDLIPVKNGLFDRRSLKLLPFDPTIVFTYKLNMAYDPDAPAIGPIFDKHLKEILSDEKERDRMQEIFGYTMLPDMPYHVIIWFVGRGRNGKGVLTRTLIGVLGETNACNVPPARINDRFQKANMVGKLLNVTHEPDTHSELATEGLKTTSGQDQQDAEVKGKQDPIKATLFCKSIISANKMPRINDDSDGWWSRNIIVEFTEQFTAENGKEIINLEQLWLSDEKEKSALFNWMVAGLIRLERKGKFTESQKMQETKAIYKRYSDPMGTFFAEQCRFDITLPGAIPMSRAYELYKDWAFEGGYTIESPKTFGSRIKQQPHVGEKPIRIAGKLVKAYTHVEIKATVTDFTDVTDSNTGVDKLENYESSIEIGNNSNICNSHSPAELLVSTIAHTNPPRDLALKLIKENYPNDDPEAVLTKLKDDGILCEADGRVLKV